MAFNDPDKQVPVSELLEDGIVAEVNRIMLHPLGLALWVNGETGELGIYKDDDPAGIIFQPGMDLSRRHQAYDSRYLEASRHRNEAHDFIVQPRNQLIGEIDADPS